MDQSLADTVEVAAHAVAILAAIGGALAVFFKQVVPWFSERRSKRVLQRRLGLENYSDQQLENALRYYVHPNCQQTDPSGHEEERALALVQEPLFRTLSRELSNTSAVRHIIILADSGMGKTSAVLNYCARHLRSRRRKSFGVHVVHLGSPNVEELIQRAEVPGKTVLFLDALDEDTNAVEDHHGRIEELLRISTPFRSIVITCRTQFFTKDEEIPRETGVIKSAPRRAGEGGEYLFYKLYLSPFSDDEVREYLRRRYPLWEWLKRRKARRILDQMSTLAMRPMLLAHIDDLLRKERSYSRAVDVYEEMVDAWIHREEGFVRDPSELLRFSKLLAVELYMNREERGSEWINVHELEVLGQKWNVRLARHTLTGRSLLNRDAAGNYKFAHRSIMEYLYVQSFWEGDRRCALTPWTDQMLLFLRDRLHQAPHSDRERVASLVDRGSGFHARLIIHGLRYGPPAWFGLILDQWFFHGVADEDIGTILFADNRHRIERSASANTHTIAVKGFPSRTSTMLITVADSRLREMVIGRATELCEKIGMRNIRTRGGLRTAIIRGDPP